MDRQGTLGEEITFTEQPKVHSHSQIFRYGQSIFCLLNQSKFSDFFDLCLHWVSVVHRLGWWVWLYFCLSMIYITYLPLCNVRGLWAHFRILPQCYWLLPWTNLAPSIGFPLCQFCQWTFYVSGKKRRVEKATFHEIRKRVFLLTLQTKLSI